MKEPDDTHSLVSWFHSAFSVGGWRVGGMPENRVGMIVCGAFLGLVSAVVVAKMRQPAAEPDQAVAAAAHRDSCDQRKRRRRSQRRQNPRRSRFILCPLPNRFPSRADCPDLAASGQWATKRVRTLSRRLQGSH